MALIDLDLTPDDAKLRRFGAAGLVVFGALAALGHEAWELPLLVVYGLGALAAASGLAAALRPACALPLYLVLTLAAYPVGLLVSYVVLAILFFLVLTPVGLLFSLIGRDALRRGCDAKRSGYWIPRGEAPSMRRYFHPF